MVQRRFSNMKLVLMMGVIVYSQSHCIGRFVMAQT